MIHFSGCAYLWLFSQVAPVADFLQVTHVADLFFLVARFRRWLLFQIVPVDYFFFTGRASHSQVAPALVAVIFFQVLLIDDFFAGSHEFFADFLFRLRTSLTFPRSRPSLIFPQVTHVADFFSGSHEYVNDFLLRLRKSLIFSLVAPVADFSPGNSRRWSLFPGRTIPLLTSFSDCARRWLYFHRSRQSQFFFMLLLSLLSFSKLCLSMNSLPASTSSFSGCARHWLFSQVAPVANFYFKLRTSLTFSQVAPVADFAPGYACRWLFFRVAGVRRWFPSQVAHIIDFFPGRARCWFSPGYSRRWFVFPGRTIPSLTSLSDCACRWLLLHRSRQSLTGRASSCRCYFFPSCAYRWFFANSLEFFADFFFRLCPSLTAFSQVATVASFFSCCSCRC